MRFTRDELVMKALLALEDVVQECRYRKPRRSFAVRFALAYLWTQSASADRQHFNALWAALGSAKSPWSFSVANGALGWVYKAVGVERDEEIASQLWRRWTKEEGRGGGCR